MSPESELSDHHFRANGFVYYHGNAILGKGPWLEVPGFWHHKNVAMPRYRRISASVCYPKNATPDRGAWVDVNGLWRHENVIMPHCRRNYVMFSALKANVYVLW